MAKVGKTRSLDMGGERSWRTFGHNKSENQVKRWMRSSDMHIWKSEESFVWAYNLGSHQPVMPSKALEIECEESDERAQVPRRLLGTREITQKRDTQQLSREEKTCEKIEKETEDKGKTRRGEVMESV